MICGALSIVYGPLVSWTDYGTTNEFSANLYCEVSGELDRGSKTSSSTPVGTATAGLPVTFHGTSQAEVFAARRSGALAAHLRHHGTSSSSRSVPRRRGTGQRRGPTWWCRTPA